MHASSKHTHTHTHVHVRIRDRKTYIANEQEEEEWYEPYVDENQQLPVANEFVVVPCSLLASK